MIYRGGDSALCQNINILLSNQLDCRPVPSSNAKSYIGGASVRLSDPTNKDTKIGFMR